jgi:hypothetical protein
LDLGQTADPSALAVLEQTQDADPDSRARYACRHLKRWPLGTPYPAIVAELGQLLATPPLPQCTLVVDATGCGRPVVDMIRQARPPAGLVPVTITAGHTLTYGTDGYHVPKREWVSTLQLLLQGRRLQIARALPEAGTLERELLSFQTRITPAAHEAFGAWREDTHDDLVMALALAGWCAETLGRRDRLVADREVVLWPLVRQGHRSAAAEACPAHGLRIEDPDGDIIVFNGHRIDLREDERHWWDS